MSSVLDLERATRIAEEYLERVNTNGEFRVIFHTRLTMEREFGWVFFWGPSDPLILVAGNAPLIVDRKDGVIHVTGTESSSFTNAAVKANDLLLLPDASLIREVTLKLVAVAVPNSLNVL